MEDWDGMGMDGVIRALQDESCWQVFDCFVLVGGIFALVGYMAGLVCAPWMMIALISKNDSAFFHFPANPCALHLQYEWPLLHTVSLKNSLCYYLPILGFGFDAVYTDPKILH